MIEVYWETATRFIRIAESAASWIPGIGRFDEAWQELWIR